MNTDGNYVLDFKKVCIAVKESLLWIVAVAMIFASFSFVMFSDKKENMVAKADIFVDIVQDKEKIADVSRVMNSLSDILLKRDVLDKILGELKASDTLKYKDISAKVTEGTQIISVTVSNNDKELSLEVVGKILDFASGSEFKSIIPSTVGKIEVINSPHLDSNVKKNNSNSLKVALPGILGLFLAITFVVFREIYKNPFRSYKDIQSIKNLEPLAEIPKISKIKNKDFPIITDSSLNDKFLEAYRVLRTNLKYAMESAGLHSNVIMLASNQEKDESSKVAINLAAAISMALQSGKVLLVDLNFRDNPISKELKIPVEQKNDINILNMQDIKYMDGLNIHILPTYYSGNCAPELLGSADMRNFLDKVSQEYDYVICNTAPLSKYADASILSDYVLGIVLVIAYGDTSYKCVIDSKEQLEKSQKTHILGAILNNCK